MRITMLVALLGRRVSEICLLDRDPLLPLRQPSPAADRPSPAAVDGQAPLPADEDRRRAGHHPRGRRGRRDHPRAAAVGAAVFAEHGAPGTTPKYLFLAPQMNRNGDRPYSVAPCGAC